MDDLLSARALMGLSLFFHTFFTPLGIGLPLLLFITEGIGLKTGDQRYRSIARGWTPVVGLLFAVGAVSGTVLSFELGMLWPGFMNYAGGIIGMPFSLEGFAFFTEAIFLAAYIYGWDRLSARAHWLLGIPLFVSAALSAVFVIAANSWMNAPDGFSVVNGEVVNVNPWDAMFNAAWAHQAIHGTIASYVVTGFAIAGVYAWLGLRGKWDARSPLAMKLAMGMGLAALVVQIVSGDLASRRVYDLQPSKFAAMEGVHETQEGAPFVIGGVPIDGENRFAIEIPKGLSLLMQGDPDAEIRGMDQVPEDERPNEVLTHLSFQAMVGSGFAMLGIALWYWAAWWRNRGRDAWMPGRWLARASILGGFLSFVALQAGWFVTEFGRQPWVVYGYLRTEDAATSRGGVDLIFLVFTVLYIVLAVGLIYVLFRWPWRRWEEDAPAPADPRPAPLQDGEVSNDA
ncbi:MAG: cytochrome ubiquinol oxidase subunit I [Dehalococcoidia bacterium]|nr:cytochrome ubiquinol oxidase subunit I [Dehalococcoidia bacterium]